MAMAFMIGLKFVIGAAVFLWLSCTPVQQALLPGCLHSLGTLFGGPDSPFFAHCSCSLDACYREVINARYSLLHPPCILIFLSPKEIWSLQRCKDDVVQGQSLLQRTDVPGSGGKNTDGGNGV